MIIVAKTAFVGFGEVNTPIDIIIKKCTDSAAARQAISSQKKLKKAAITPLTYPAELSDMRAASSLFAKHLPR